MITYPVNPNSRFTFKLAGVTQRGVPWPRSDGQPLQSPAPGLVILEEIVAALPTYNANTQKLDSGSWVDDEAQQTATFTRAVVALSSTELANKTKRNLVKQAIPVLRNWSTQAAGITVTTGNAVTVVQGIVDNLETFYDRFADLLELQNFDK